MKHMGVSFVYMLNCAVFSEATEGNIMAGQPTPPMDWFPLIRPAIKPLFLWGVRGPGGLVE